MSMIRWTWPDVSPLCQSALRERDQYQASPVAMLRCSASAFICATMSTSDVRWSTTTAVINPLGSKRGSRSVPSSIRCRSASASAAADILLAALDEGNEAKLLGGVGLEHAGEA